jgi:hypothetical protein
LDYLVWELVLAEGNIPTTMNAFPVALTEKAYEDDIKKRHRLDGVGASARDMIRSFQPEQHPLAILDNLTNINKHRRVLFTAINGSTTQPSTVFLHIRTQLRALAADGQVLEEMPFWIYITVNDGAAKGTEITVLLDSLSYFVGNTLLSSFGIILERK